MNRLLLAGALALLTPAAALAQPAPHHTVGQVVDVRGEVSLPAGGAPIIQANKSNLFQVGNEPFRSILAGCAGRRVEARLRMTQVGPFGGRADALGLQARTDDVVVVRTGASSYAPRLTRLAAGRSFTITGATTRWYRVRLEDGRRGYVSKEAKASIGAAPSTGGGLVATLSAAQLQQLKDDWEMALIDSTADPAGAGLPAAARAQQAAWNAGWDTEVKQLSGPAGTTYAVVASAKAGAVDFELLVKVYDAAGTLLASGRAGDSPQVYWD